MQIYRGVGFCGAVPDVRYVAHRPRRRGRPGEAAASAGCHGRRGRPRRAATSAASLVPRAAAVDNGAAHHPGSQNNPPASGHDYLCAA